MVTTGMTIQKYRKWYLQQNWGQNRFRMIKYWVGIQQIERTLLTTDLQRNHPWVLSGKAYWITHNTLCVGYELDNNPEIFRPIFSHKRQILLNMVNEKYQIKIWKKFWHRMKSKYLFELIKIKKLPMDCVNNILKFLTQKILFLPSGKNKKDIIKI